jgi:hypothetical protein
MWAALPPRKSTDAPEGWIAAPLIGQSKVRMVRETQHLGAELQPVSFPKAEILQQGKIRREDARPHKGIAANTADWP